VEVRQRDALRRVLRVQVVRKPDEIGVELAPRLLGRDLAEPAKRSDVVAPDDDRMLRHVTCNAREPPIDSPADYG
jgi:hypothetical protein